MRPDRQRTYHDPLHGAITLRRDDPVEALLIGLIDTPAFQRLRRIRQLGPASLTFHGAEASRFTHSLGAMQVARRALDSLSEPFPDLRQHRAVLLVTALLHDLGHGPFSHTGEEIFGSHHESWSCRLVRESAPIRELLDAHDPALAEQVVAVLTRRYPLPIISQLVSSQLDCDRLDYLIRDSYFSGASYGHLDLDRILAALSFDPDSGELAVDRKGVVAIEHYLTVRSFMYGQVYHHPKNIAANWLLEQTFARARQLLGQPGWFCDDTLAAWLRGPIDQLPLERYLAGDDTLCLYHLERWRQAEDPLLRDLSRRFQDRDLPKARSLEALDTEGQEQLLRRCRDWATAAGWDAAVMVGLRRRSRLGYSRYRQGIKVLTDEGIQPISGRSPLIRALIQPSRTAWLIYPKPLDEAVKREIAALRT